MAARTQDQHVCTGCGGSHAVNDDLCDAQRRRKKPRYLRGFTWRWTEEKLDMPGANLSLTALPFPSPLLEVLKDTTLTSLLHDHPNLCKTVTPVNVDLLSVLLHDHPNRPFVDSVLKGLTEVFGPFATALPAPHKIQDNHASSLQNPGILDQQREVEVRLNRFFNSFRAPLKGMRVTPFGLVAKPNSEKLRLITDHSAGQPSINDVIPREERRASYDGMHAFAPWLVRANTLNKETAILWKSDVSSAFRLLPMHPRWQLQ